MKPRSVGCEPSTVASPSSQDGGVDHPGPRCAAALSDRCAVEDDRLLPISGPRRSLRQRAFLWDADLDGRDPVVERQVEEELALLRGQATDELDGIGWK